jgi:hypothetical protein
MDYKRPVRRDETLAARRGKEAFLRGVPRGANPYTDRALADRWLEGYHSTTSLISRFCAPCGSAVSYDANRKRRA